MNASPIPYDAEPTGPSEEAGQLAVSLVHGGFTTFDEVVEALVETFEDEEDAADRVGPEEAEALVRAVWSERLAAQGDWPLVTEAERLLAVLRDLSGRQIVAEPHFACCMRCGLTEIGAKSDGRARGFVFFHEQDTERAVAGDGLTLAYGVFGGDPDGTAAIGREVTAALTGAGLSVEWNGSPTERIRVAPLDWRIRLAAPVDVRV